MDGGACTLVVCRAGKRIGWKMTCEKEANRSIHKLGPTAFTDGRISSSRSSACRKCDMFATTVWARDGPLGVQKPNSQHSVAFPS